MGLPSGQSEQMINRIYAFEIRAPNQLIESRQRRRQLRHLDGGSVNHRDEGAGSPSIGGVLETQLPLQGRNVLVNLPSRSTVHRGCTRENSGEFVPSQGQFAP